MHIDERIAALEQEVRRTYRLFRIASLCGIGLVAVLIMGIVGQGDYEDAAQAEKFYCEMVKEGHWPNYKQVDCK